MALTDYIKQYATPIVWISMIAAAAFIAGADNSTVLGYEAKKYWYVFIALLAICLYIFTKMNKALEAKQKVIEENNRSIELLKREARTKAKKSYDVHPLDTNEFDINQLNGEVK